MNGMDKMFGDLRSGGMGGSAGAPMPPKEEPAGGIMTCPVCGAKFEVVGSEEGQGEGEE